MQTEQIFKNSKRAISLSDLFFGAHARRAIGQLHGFVQTANDYADAMPKKVHELYDLAGKWQDLSALPMRDLAPGASDDANTRAAKNIARLKIRYGFDVRYVDSFLTSKIMNISPKEYFTLKDTLQYVYGSGEVVGLMVASILRLHKGALVFAAMQGRAMQWLQFVRDIAQDNMLGRRYFPREDLERFGLDDLTARTAYARPQVFGDFVQFQLERYHRWQSSANEGLHYVPKRQRIALQAVIDSCGWTARQIAKKPLVVFERKVQPPKMHLLLSALGHAFD